jgi:dipeptidyl aminopeptidase/acylaminoacyl peptidase
VHTRPRHSLLIPVAMLAATIAVASLDAQRTASTPAPDPPAFTIAQVTGYAFPSDLTAAPQGNRIAWASVLRGVRNIWIAQGPEFTPRKLTNGREDDGQELTNLAFSADGRFLVWTRGGDHGANWPAEGNLMPDPTSSPVQPKLEVWAANVEGAPAMIGEGDSPAPSPRGDIVAFEHGREIWSAPLDGSAPARRLFFARGTNGAPAWSPDGRTLAFVSDRGSYSFIGLYTSESEPIRYLAPSTSQDSSPTWSPDGATIAFVRRPGRGGPAAPPLEPQPAPWSIWVADPKTGAAHEVWKSADTLRASYPRTEGGANLRWAAGDRLTFLSYQDGWPHLYSIAAAGGTPLLLTPGNFMVEYVTMTPDRRTLVYNANTGQDRDDGERRHLFRVPVDAATPTAITSGSGIEWQPAVVSDGGTIAYLGSDAVHPPGPFVFQRTPRALAAEAMPADFPYARLVTPEHVTFNAADGTTVHGQLFKSPRSGGAARRPAIVFVHGGPPRQMLLGFHYMFYYANSYAMNQYLASRGFIVLSVNYRLGIGYGYEFHQPKNGGARGAGEYQDVLAGGKYLQSRPDVDGSRIGIWGGSYGGYLTALALGRSSDVFAAGVDIHGVHTRMTSPSEAQEIAASIGDGLSKAQLEEAARVAWDSSPNAHVKTWRSPVLLIHGDDDRNVRVDQTVDLVQRLRAKGVRYEEMVVPDEIHDFLLYRTWTMVNTATASFLERELGKPAGTQSRP